MFNKSLALYIIIKNTDSQVISLYMSDRESLWHAEFFLLPCVIVKHKGDEVSCFASECETHPW